MVMECVRFRKTSWIDLLSGHPSLVVLYLDMLALLANSLANQLVEVGIVVGEELH